MYLLSERRASCEPNCSLEHENGFVIEHERHATTTDHSIAKLIKQSNALDYANEKPAIGRIEK